MTSTATDRWRMLSLFAGVGGFDLAAQQVGIHTVAFSEIAPYPRAVMRARFPDAEDLGDITTVTDLQLCALAPVHLICGGFPCQDLSVAGKRAGLHGERSGLFWELLRVRDLLQPWFLVLENVPGLLSSHGGKDFAVLLNALTGREGAHAVTPADLRFRSIRGKLRRRAGAGAVVGPAGMSCWRVLDSQHWVPQRRRRVFLFHAAPAALERFGADRLRAVLLECDGVSGDPHTGEQARSSIADQTLSRARSPVGGGDDPGTNNGAPIIVDTVRREQDLVAYNIFPAAGQGADLCAKETAVASLSGRSMETERGTRVLQEPGGGQVAVAFAENQQGELREMSVTGQISRGGGKPGQGYQAVIPPTERPRRLTPLECSRLQGFPDDYLLPASDTQWYRAMGNAVTMPVVRWILARLYALR